jgi:hypothetical protein
LRLRRGPSERHDPDLDGDGVPNGVERENGTNPLVADTGGGSTADGADCFPLDAALTCVAPNPSDVAPPVITLIEPTNAVPLP